MRVGTRTLQNKGAFISQNPNMVPTECIRYSGGGLHIFLWVDVGQQGVADINWKATAPTVADLSQIAQQLFPDGQYVMRVTHSDTIRMWGNIAGDSGDQDGDWSLVGDGVRARGGGIDTGIEEADHVPGEEDSLAGRSIERDQA